MISLNHTLLTAAGLLRLGNAAPVRHAEAQGAPVGEEGRKLSPDAPESDDPFFLAVAEALRAAGYLDSRTSVD